MLLKLSKKKSTRITGIILLSLVLCLMLSSVAMAAPGYIVGGYRFLSSEVGSNPSLMQELNGLLGDNFSSLIVDLDGSPFNYSSFIAAGGVAYEGGFQAFATANPATIPSGTLIKYANGTTEADPTAVESESFEVEAIY